MGQIDVVTLDWIATALSLAVPALLGVALLIEFGSRWLDRDKAERDPVRRGLSRATLLIMCLDFIVALASFYVNHELSRAQNAKLADLERRVEESEGYLSTDQVEALARSTPPREQHLLKFLACKYKNESQVVGILFSDYLDTAGWSTTHDLQREEIGHNGIRIITRKNTPSTERLSKVLKGIGLEFELIHVGDFGEEHPEDLTALISIGNLD